MTHHEKDFGDHLESCIIKLDGAIEQQYAKMRELKANEQIGTSHYFTQYCLHEAHIYGLEQAKNILLGKG